LIISEKDLVIISQEGEGQTIEFKESFTPAISKEIVAFANSIGGRIFFGITDKNQIKEFKEHIYTIFTHPISSYFDEIG